MQHQQLTMPTPAHSATPKKEQTIYRMALPDAFNRLDLCQLSRDEEIFAENFLNDLLRQQEVERELEPPYATDTQLQHIFFEARNRERIGGAKTIGLGFPLLALTKEGEQLLAPLFIWQMRLEPMANKFGLWLIRHAKEQKITVNAELVQLLKDRFGLNVADEWEKLAAHKQLTKKKLQDIAHQLNATIGADGLQEDWKMEAALDLEQVSTGSIDAGVHWTGILSLYPPALPTAVLNTYRLEETLAPQLMEKVGHEFGLFPLDPYQASAWEAIRQQRVTVVEGVSGTGKTQLLSYIVSNALSNGQKCLVISNKVPALRQIQSLLEQKGLQRLQLLLQDPVNDRPLLLEVLKTLAQAKAEPLVFNKDNFQLVLQRCQREKAKLDKQYQTVREQIFGDLTWTQTVGEFLHNNRKEGKELLSSQLNPQDFKFTFAEYNSLLTVVANSRPLHEKLLTLKHPLNNLFSSIFTGKEKAESYSFVQERLDDFLEKAAQLHHRYIIKVNAYTEKLIEHYEQYYRHLMQLVVQLEDKMADAKNQFGEDLESSTLALRGVFSKRHKEVLETREAIISTYQHLERTFANQPYFDFQFQAAGDGKNIPKVQQNIADFKTALQTWGSSITKQVQEEIKRLSRKTVHYNLDYREQIKDLEYSLEILVGEINEAQLYSEPLENKMLTIPKRQKYLESIIEQLENTQFYLRDHDLYYDWRRHWLLLNDAEQKIVQALAKVKPKDWEAAFKSWYLNNCLAKAYDPSLVQQEGMIQDFAMSCQVLSSLLVRQIQGLWEVKKEEALRDLRLKNREAYQQLFGKRNQELAEHHTLADAFQSATPAITGVLPVLLMTPEVANAVFAQAAPHFDWILVDEAHQLPANLLPRPASVGKRIVLFGDSSLLVSQQQPSALEVARQFKLPIHPVKYLHQSSEKAINRIRAVLCGVSDQHNVAPASSGLWETAFQLEEVEGRFNEKEQTNEVEAEQVVRLLNDIRKTPQRTFPTVGIVCFTTEQRDLMAAYLLKVKSSPGEGRDLVQQLERNGLGIFRVDELYGQHFDVLIVCSTYGTIDLQGSIAPQLASLETENGNAWIRLLISRAGQKIFFLNSIPAATLEEAQQNVQQNGLFLVANLFAFAEAIEHDNQEKAIVVLQRLQTALAPAAASQDNQLFMEEVAHSLQPYFDSSRIQQNVQVEYYCLPLVIKPAQANLPATSLHTDGFLADTPSTNYEWEYSNQEHLTTLGYIYQPLWSANWWKNPAQEARKLASVVIKRGAQKE